MKTTAITMSVFVVMVIATTTALTLGTSSAMAASKTHTHVTQLKSSGLQQSIVTHIESEVKVQSYQN